MVKFVDPFFALPQSQIHPFWVDAWRNRALKNVLFLILPELHLIFLSNSPSFQMNPNPSIFFFHLTTMTFIFMQIKKSNPTSQKYEMKFDL
jgi:hypothetical protein